jgi:hypothetical protein
VEKAFEVLQAQFAIICRSARMWDKATLRQIMITCVIMHNMIVEDERSKDEDEDVHYEGVGQLVNLRIHVVFYHLFFQSCISHVPFQSCINHVPVEYFLFHQSSAHTI